MFGMTRIQLFAILVFAAFGSVTALHMSQAERKLFHELLDNATFDQDPGGVSAVSGTIGVIDNEEEEFSILDGTNPQAGVPTSCSSLGWRPAVKGERRRVIDGYAYNGESLLAQARYEELQDYINGTAILITEANFHGKLKSPVEAPPIPMSFHTLLPAAEFEKCGSADAGGFNYCAVSMTKNSIATPIERFELDDEDWVIFSDPDEIPDREVIRLLHECDVPVGPTHANDHLRLHSGADTHGHHMYTFKCGFSQSNWVDSACMPRATSCKGPVVMRAGTMRRHGLRTFQAQVQPWCVEQGPYASCERHVHPILLQKSMWHLSSFGGPDMLKEKMMDNSDSYDDLGMDMMQTVEGCIDHDTERKNVDMQLKKLEVKFTYPHVPHSIADAPERYSIFFGWDRAAMGSEPQVDRAATGSGPRVASGTHDDGVSRTEYTFYNSALFARLGKESELARQLRADAADALAHGPWRVTDKTGIPPSGDKHDYFDCAKYKGHGNLVDNLAKDEEFDRARFSYMARNTTILGLAYKVFGETKYCSKAAKNIETFYTGPDGVSPHMKYTHADAGDLAHFGVIGWKDHYYLFDAASMVEECFDDGQYRKLQLWAGQLLSWLQSSDFGQAEHNSRNNHGTWYDVLVVSLTRFVPGRANANMHSKPDDRMLAQIDGKSGLMPLEMKRPNCLHYQMFGLQGLVTLDHVSRGEQSLEARALLKKAVKTNVPALNPSWERCADKPMSPIQSDMTRFPPILMMAATRDDRLGLAGDVFEQACSLNPLFHDDAGIAPYWQFALDTLAAE